MELQYRGVNYTTQSAHVAQYQSNSLINGKYRGASAQIYPRVTLSHQSLIHLKYRGVDYSKGLNPYPQKTITPTRLISVAV
jgi:hypothetical protein